MMAILRSKEALIKSSLKFLRKTQWARDKVESLYVSRFKKQSAWGNSK